MRGGEDDLLIRRQNGRRKVGIVWQGRGILSDFQADQTSGVSRELNMI